MDWNEKTVVVTGAGTGVGKMVSHELARRGAIVYVTARSLEKAQPVADEIRAAGLQAFARKWEVGNWTDSREVVSEVAREHGKLDALINNAAVLFVGEFFEMDERAIERVVHTNLTGVLVGSLHAYQIMKDQGQGLIVNVASLGGVLPSPAMVAYSATKFGLVGLTEGLAAEAAPFGVDVKVVCLGFIESEILNKAEMSRGSADTVHAMIPMKPMPADKAARAFVDQIGTRRRLIFVPGYGRAYHALHRFFPALLRRGAKQTMDDYRGLVDDN